MKRVFPIINLICLGLFLLMVSACGKRTAYTPDQPYWKDNDTVSITEPVKRSPSLIWQLTERTTFRQAEQLLDLNRSLGKISGNPKQSWNINSYDEVPNSSWFTNRHGLHGMDTEALQAGMAVTSGPDTTGKWTVFRPKVGGVTAGFWIKDAKGDAYILKFDPPNNPEMATGSAAITGRLLYACGYNVPQETITSFHPDDLVIKEGVTYKEDGRKYPFTREKLFEILEKAYHNEDGTIRCLASLALPNIKGPFSFSGVRKDDPNDWCRHEHRRELRALYVFCSFVNHWDIKDENSMDIFADENGSRFIKHHLLDFGSTMGSAGHGSQSPRSGYANSFDLRDAIVSFFTLGLKKWQWEEAKPYQYPSIGYFESEIFHPAKWDPIYPIPAFENMTNRDAYWAAKIVMRFSDEDLRVLIEVGRYSNPEAREYLFQTLKARRDKIGKHWFSKVNPLDEFQLIVREKALTISFTDLLRKYGFDKSKSVSYRYDLQHMGKKIVSGEANATPEINITHVERNLLIKAFQEANQDSPDRNLFKISIRTTRDKEKNSRPVHLWLWFHPEDSRIQIVGIEHVD
ncbi:MAG: hypothetical protein KAR42_08365 [candidate division Zixibacteria bacterium]|nr:hypothetical protein [candidate division Zixibacteria bacterium]